MILWTIQPEAVYNSIIGDGVYHCDFSQSFLRDHKMQYDWLVSKMIKHIGERPKVVSYPVWAWYKWNGKRKQPDLRSERWGNGFCGDVFYCIKIQIPDEQVLLSDFDSWSIILVNGLISESEEEHNALEKRYNALSKEKQKNMKDKNWERVFNIEELDNDWVSCGNFVQATFWELKKENIVFAKKFVSAHARKI